MKAEIGQNPRLLAILGLAEHAAVPIAATPVILLIWEILTRALQVPADILPGPTRIFIEIWLEADRLRIHASITAFEMLASLLMAVFAAIPLSFLIDASPYAKRVAKPLISALNRIPLVLLIPLSFIWLGYGIRTKLVICLLLCMIAITQSMLNGLAALPAELKDFLRTTGASYWRCLALVLFPSTLPCLFAGMKKGVALALLGSVIGEYVEAERGLGFLIVYATARLDTPLLCASFMILAVIALAILGAVFVLERILVPWHFARHTEQGALSIPQ